MMLSDSCKDASSYGSWLVQKSFEAQDSGLQVGEEHEDEGVEALAVGAAVTC